MAMGLVDDSLFELELEDRSENKNPRAQVVDINRGRGEGNVEVPESLRKIIGETALVDNNTEAKALAGQFGISDSSVSAYKNGSTSTSSYNQPSEDLNSHLNDVKTQISQKARAKLVSAIDQLTDEKLGSAKAVDLSSIAKNMSAVVKNMEVEKNDNSKNGPTFVIFAPKTRPEESYDIINVSE